MSASSIIVATNAVLLKREEKELAGLDGGQYTEPGLAGR
jgi:hypothetical protein